VLSPGGQDVSRRTVLTRDGKGEEAHAALTPSRSHGFPDACIPEDFAYPFCIHYFARRTKEY
jgi:hypothetical protein